MANAGLSDGNPSKTTLYIYEGEEVDSKIDKMILSEYGEYDVISYNNQVYNFEMGLINYFSVAPYNDKEILLYVDNSLIDPPYSVYGLMFYYDGTLDEAQKYFDDLLLRNGLVPSIILFSAEIGYETFYDLAVFSVTKATFSVVFFLLGLNILNMQLIELDEAENEKKYYLEFIEGNRIASFFHNFVLTNILIWAFVQCLFYFVRGEQQRVAIAKMIAKDCNVIFADEPTASLDDYNKAIIMGLFDLLKQQGKTIVIVSHDIDIKKMADRVVYL